MENKLEDGIIQWGNGQMSESEEIIFFQTLVDTGRAWTLQGMYGRRAWYLAGLGKITIGASA